MTSSPSTRPESTPARIRWIPLVLLCSQALLPRPAAAAEPTDLPALVRGYEADRQSVGRFYELPWSEERQARLERLFEDWAVRLRAVAFEPLPPDAQIDYVLLRTEIASELSRLRLEAARRRDMEPLLPFRSAVQALELTRWRMDKLDVQNAAGVVSALPGSIRQLRERIEKGRKKPADRPADAPASQEATNTPAADRLQVSPVLAQRAAAAAGDLRATLKSWASYYDGSVPEFSWWMKKPVEGALAALDEYAKFLREDIAGIKGRDEDPLVGDPIGETALREDLASEWLAYSAAELVTIGEREFAWCEAEMKKAAAEMGLGDDWKAALSKVKTLHVPPGQQDQVVAEEARHAIQFLKSRDLVTIPPLCEELWRTSMLSTDAQKTLPFAAYSGPNMLVAYARDDMKHDDKLMAMRGNNRPFTRIVTPHELIPGHHLEAFMTARHQEHRRPFRTPFFVEGWALYWETRLWDLGYGRTPEERVGMLFWRMHRCARIIVSLKFHLGEMSPAQMVDFLVDRVGHERLGATSEVRRFIGGAYSPLYQCAYMIGGLQLRALHAELVGPGKRSDRDFNDAVLRLGAIPIELVRASLLRSPLRPDSTPTWRPLLAPQNTR